MFLRPLAAAVFAATLALPAAAESVLYRGNGAEPAALDPHKVTGQWESNIVGDMLMGLMTEDADGNPIPGAAESYTVSEDGLVWTWKLREGAVWSDGEPVTAHDFVFALRRINDPATAAQYASITHVLKNARAINEGRSPKEELGVRAVDDLTLEMTLEHPAPYMPSLVTHNTFFPIAEHVVEAVGDKWTQPGNFASNGPFILQDWRTNDAVELIKNPLFFDAASVALDRVVFFSSEDATANVKRFQAGEIDLASTIPSGQIEDLRAQIPDEVRVAPWIVTFYIAFNFTRPPFDDQRVRMALSMLVDRTSIANTLLGRGERLAYALVPDVLGGYGHVPQLAYKDMTLTQRHETAKALLADAGFGPDKPLTFKFAHSQNPDVKRVSAALQEMWKAGGVIASLEAMETKTMYDNLRVQNFDVSWAGWIADFKDAKNYLYLAETRSGEMNYTKYSNPAFDELVIASDNEKDEAKRGDLLQQAEQILLDDHAMAPLYFGVSTALVRTYVTGYNDNPLNIHRSRWIAVTGERTPLN
jgi:oligopeptide transport system substrate-binding protein